MSQMQVLKSYIKQVRGFSALLADVNFITAENGNCVATTIVTEEKVTPVGTLHGGYSAALVDCVSSFGLITLGWKLDHASININLSYINSAKLNDEIKVISTLLRSGKTLAFLDVEIRNAKTDQLLIKAEHTKYKFDKS